MRAPISANPFNQALVYAGLGDKDRTLEALNRLVALGPVRVGRALNIPEMALPRGDPRLKALRKKAGLPEQCLRGYWRRCVRGIVPKLPTVPDRETPNC
jgi:hypothetical protein